MIALNVLHALLGASISLVIVSKPGALRADAAIHRRTTHCSCIPNGSTTEALRAASIVVHGTVLSIRSEAPLSYRRIVSVAIHAQWKPTAAFDTLEVATGRGGGDCGYPFAVGTAYLIYAYQPESRERPVTGICSRTKLYTEALEDVRDLGRPIRHPTR